MRTIHERVMADARREGNPCIRCHSTGSTCGRHYNGQRQHAYGKGRGIKGHWIGIADLCKRCDQDFQEGSVEKNNYIGKDQYSEEFQHWCIMSNIRRDERGFFDGPS